MGAGNELTATARELMLTVLQSRRVAHGMRTIAAIAVSVALAGCSRGGYAAFPVPVPYVPPPSASVSIVPYSVRVAPGGTQTFTATVTGVTDTGVTFNVLEGASAGTITAAG